MTHRFAQTMTTQRSRLRTVLTPRLLARAAALGLAGLAVGISACTETDSWLFNPSVVGRWEVTPTVVPVLERIDVIENDTGDFVEITQVTREDLMPMPIETRLKPGDPIKVSILDFPEAGRPGEFERVLDPLGYIDLPMMPRIKAGGLSGRSLQLAIEKALAEARLIDRPIVQIEFGQQQEATFRIFGIVEKPGQFRIPGPDYRLLQAITDAGGVNPAIKKLHIIRQVSLADELDGTSSTDGLPTSGDQPILPPIRTNPQPTNTPPPATGEDLLKVIEDLTGAEGENTTPPATPESGEPAPAEPAKPQTLSQAGGYEHEALLSALSSDPQPVRRKPAARAANKPAMSAFSAQDSAQPAIDLPESDPASAPAQPTPTVHGGGQSSAGGQWVFLNGEWVQVFRKAYESSGLPEGQDPLKGRSTGIEDILTQRVIEVPIGPLLQGAAQYNVVIRPGDVISVPGPDQGFVYAEGPGINRVGVYSLPSTGQLTIQRLVAAAGGLSEIAIPERVDITRRVGDKRQATVRLNLRAIYEGTQPDIVLKSDDLVNFGTSFWATPMAIVRNGFRMTYGFGFLLDRNFGSDVFGVPPEARARNGFN